MDGWEGPGMGGSSDEKQGKGGQRRSTRETAKIKAYFRGSMET